MEKEDSWELNRKLILHELSKIEDIRTEIKIMHQDMIEIKTTMKIKQGILGFIAAGIGVILSALVERFAR